MLFDYSTVTPDSVRSAVDEAIAQGEELVAALVAAPRRTWKTTIAPLDRLAAIMIRASGVGPFMARVHPDKQVRDAGQQAEQALITWQSDLIFRRELYKAVEAFAEGDGASALQGEHARLLTFIRRDLRRAGHLLGPQDRARVQDIRRRLVEIGVAFARNIDEAEGGVDLRADQLGGLPPDYLERLASGDEEGTYRVSLDYPDYYPFMDFAEDRGLRRELQFSFFNRAVEVNTPLLVEAVALRHEMAGIFGQPSWAHYAMEEKMAKEPPAVEAFYADLVPPLQTIAAAELADLRETHGSDDLQAWDHRYVHTAIKRDRYGVDNTEVAAYFPLDQVLDGMFTITGEVFGLTYKENPDAVTWHPDVTVHDVADAETGAHLATFYMDLFPREGKFGHAAAFDLVPGHATPDGYVAPVTAIAANFTKPMAESPSLLKHDELLTLFHEFGHVLHNSLGHTALVRFSGFNTEWDFVEAPSQIMEHWCWRPEVLARFARHHQTGEPIPTELVEQLVTARDLHIALFMLRQVSFGILDMTLHGPGAEKDLDRITRETSEMTGFPHHPGTFYPASFEHLFGYDAGYYGYLWSKVFGDDMFSRFEREGVLDPVVGMQYRRTVLEVGGSRDAGEILQEFLGREPNQVAFLRNLGI